MNALKQLSSTCLGDEAPQANRPAKADNSQDRSLDAKLRSAAFDAIYTVNLDGDFLDANPACCRLLGYTCAEMLKLNARDVLELDHDETARRVAAFLSSGPLAFSARLVRKGGATINVEGRIVPASDDRFLVVMRRRSDSRSPAAGADSSEELQQLRQHVLDAMNHEFRTPLTTIMGYAHILKDLVGNENVPFVEDIERSGQKLLDTFMTAVELARLNAGAYPLYPEECDVLELLQNVIQRVQWMADLKGVEIRLDAEACSHKAVLDVHTFERVAYEVIHNAAKFTHKGQIDISLSYQATHFEVRVTDSGIGIDASYLPRMFVAFTQESQGMARKYDGIGIGLALARMICEKLDGTISVKSVKGEGTSVVFALPRNMEKRSRLQRP